MSARLEVAKAIHNAARPMVPWESEHIDTLEYWGKLADAALLAVERELTSDAGRRVFSETWEEADQLGLPGSRVQRALESVARWLRGRQP